ncbi:hypothetical protein DFH06DRAFT_1200010 [Mycena polygramma]|nr:hypothetical protein DFH06DRAFT_1200010 [Mycena polygramma]
MLPSELISHFKHPLLPEQTSAQVADLTEGPVQISRNIGYRWDEGLLCTLIDFIECCCSTVLPYRPVDTLHCVARYSTFVPQQIHPIHQIRLAAALKNLFGSDLTAHREVAENLICARFIFTCDGEIQAWLTDFEARNIFKSTFARFLTSLSSPEGDTNSDLRRWVEQIVTRLDVSISSAENLPELNPPLPPSRTSNEAD